MGDEKLDQQTIGTGKRRRFLASLGHALTLIQLSATGCATVSSKWVTHGVHFDQFSLGGGFDSAKLPDIEILEWGYGEKDPDFEGQGQKGRRGQYLVGHTPPNGGTYGQMPIGNFIYAKWRIKNTGEILEDKVDLRGRLPREMDHYEIYMFIAERQLYVFLFPPLRRKSKVSGEDEVIAGGTCPLVPKGKTILEIPGIAQYLIHPGSLSSS